MEKSTKKTTLTSLIMAMLTLFLVGCAVQEEQKSLADSSPEAVSLRISLSGESRAERFLGTFDEISTLTLDLTRNFDGRKVVTGFPLTKDAATGRWTGTLNNLIVSFDYTVTGHAYKTDSSSGSPTQVEIFRGETQHTVTSGTNSLALRLTPLLDERELSVPRITQINRPFQLEKTDNASISISVTNSDLQPLQYRFRSVDANTSLPLPEAEGGSFSPAKGIHTVDNGSYEDIATNYTAPNLISVQNLQVRVSNDLEIGVTVSFKTYITGPIDSETTVDTNPVVESISGERVGNDELKWTILVSDDDPFNSLVATWTYQDPDSGATRTFDNSTYVEDDSSSRSDVGVGMISTIMHGYQDTDSGMLRVTICESNNANNTGSCAHGQDGSTSVDLELVAGAYQQPTICDGSCDQVGTGGSGDRVSRFLAMDISESGVRHEYPPEVGSQYIPVYYAPDSQLYYSNDGLTWQEGPTNPRINIRQTPTITPMPSAVLYDGNRVLMVDPTASGKLQRGDNASLIYEQSGSGWIHIGEIPDNLSFVTTIDNGSGPYTLIEELAPLTHLAYGNGTYLGVAAKEGQLNNWCYGGPNNSWGRWGTCSGNSPATTQTIVSSDGVNWNLGTRDISIVVDNGSGPDNITVIPVDVVFNGSHFVAVADNASWGTPVVKSSDGINWSELGTISGGDRDNGTFTWDVPNDNGSTDNVILGDINHWLYGNGKFLAVAANQITNPNAYYRSYSYWSNRESSYVANAWWCSRDLQGNYLGYDDTYDQCQPYDQMQTLVSNDGSTWTTQNGNPDVSFSVETETDNGTHVDNVTVIPEAMVFHNGKFMGMKSNSDDVSATLIQSTDGLTWDLIESVQMPGDNVTKLLSAFEKLIHIDLREGNNTYCQHPSTGSWGYWEECSSSTRDRMQVHQSSDDGLTWDVLDEDVKVSLDYTTEESFRPVSIIFGNQRYVSFLDEVTVLSGNDEHIAVGSSDDGLNWSHLGNLAPELLDEDVRSKDKISVAYGNGRYVLVAAAKGGMRYKYIPSLGSWNNVYVEDLMQTLVSTDGKFWSVGNDEVEISLPSGDSGILVPTVMAYGNGEFVATDGSNVISSSDGASWSYTGSFPEPLPLTKLSYGNGNFVALANQLGLGYIRTYSEWSNRLNRYVQPSENLWWCSNDSDGNYLGYTDVYDECQPVEEIWTSTDGSSWQQETFTFTITSDNGTVDNGSVQALVFGNGRFLAYGDNSTAMTSTNGQSWSEEEYLIDGVSAAFTPDNRSLVYGEALEGSSGTADEAPLSVVRIGPSGDPESTSSTYVSRSRAKKVFVSFNRPVAISGNGSTYSWSGTESCDNFDVQYYRTSNESQCYRWNSAPQPWGDNVTVGNTVYNSTWVFDIGTDPDYGTHQIRVKSSSTLVDQSGNSLDEDFVSGKLYW